MIISGNEIVKGQRIVKKSAELRDKVKDFQEDEGTENIVTCMVWGIWEGEWKIIIHFSGILKGGAHMHICRG